MYFIEKYIQIIKHTSIYKLGISWEKTTSYFDG